jgi:tyrosine-protein phosphatase SIW14
LDDTVSKFFEDNNIQVVYVENAVHDTVRGLLSLAEEMVTESLTVISKQNNFPLLVVCKTGKNLTGVVIACLRKLQRWSLISIYEEYRRYAGGSKLQQQHEQFIELFDTDLVPIGPDAPPFLLKRQS